MAGGRKKSDSERPAGRRVADLIGRHWRKFAVGLVTLILAPVAVALISNALSGDDSNTDAGVKLGPDLRADKLVVRNPKYDTVQTRPSSMASSSPRSSKRRRRCQEWS